jgi:hypothetical protein
MKLFLLVLLPLLACAQDFAQKGTVELRSYFFPQLTNSDRGHVVAEGLIRYEASRTLLPGLRLNGAVETRVDTHHQVKRSAAVNWTDRGRQRPALSIRRLSLLYNKGRMTAEVGKQYLRWGKADILNPTDRFAPRDFLSVVDNEYLAVTAARVIYEGTADSLEIVAQPFFTPSRMPLLNQRWTVIPAEAQGYPLRDNGTRVPGGTAVGVRWNHLGDGYEASLSFYNGHNHLPLVDVNFVPALPVIGIQAFQPQLRFYGGDFAKPLPWFTVKAEAGYFTTSTNSADEYIQYVLQLERQIGELSIVTGYAGEQVTERRSTLDFAPDRGLTRAFLGRVSYQFGPRRSAFAEYAVRHNGRGAWIKIECSQTLAANVRAVAGMAIVRGDPSDFLGQFRRNSYATLALRYSF